ncbi:hypothetical protein HY626_02660 [Candidatus Uhrbacteria bacterium]|nr:hypothetical protein [Candidatus Uhrbacteria bacterium]
MTKVVSSIIFAPWPTQEAQMSKTQSLYSGSVFNDPRATKIGEFTGLLSQQPEKLQAWITSLRAGRRLTDVGYVRAPISIELTMNDGVRIQSCVIMEGTSVDRQSKNIRLLLCKWDKSTFVCCIVQINGDTINLTVHQNPPDARSNWRKPNPTIIPPTP